MAEIPDNEFEKLFQQAAASSEPEFDPKAWELMGKETRPRRPKGFLVENRDSLLLLFLTGLGVWHFSSSEDEHAGNHLEQVEEDESRRGAMHKGESLSKDEVLKEKPSKEDLEEEKVKEEVSKVEEGSLEKEAEGEKNIDDGNQSVKKIVMRLRVEIKRFPSIQRASRLRDCS